MKLNQKYLVITSDDFGMSHSVNTGILAGFQSGCLKSSNIMVPCPWAKHAANLSLKNDLPVGIHLTLTCEWENLAWRPLTHAPSLMNEEYRFHSNVKDLFENSKEAEVWAELTAQLELFKFWGLNPTHVDSHMIPSFPQEEGEKFFSDLITEFATKNNLVYTYQGDGLSLKYFDSEWRLSEHSDLAFFEYLQTLKPGIHHLICHLASLQEEQKAISSNPWAETIRTKDFQIITSPETASIFQKLGVVIIGVPELIKLHIS